MYFSKESVLSLYRKLSTLYPKDDIEQQGGTQFASEIKYFLAADYFKKQKGKACDTQIKDDKDFFVLSVGKVVLLSENGNYLATKNFAKSIGDARDFDVGSNFFSANAVAKSKISPEPQKFPNRHPQLLTIIRGVIDTYTGGYESLANDKEYLGGNIKKYAILFLWLNRFSDFSSTDSIYNDCLFNLKKNYSTELISSFRWSSQEVKNEVENLLIDIQLVDNKPSFEREDFSLSHSFESATSINKPRNRIIFGAPGTGKSNRLKNDCDIYFSSNIDIKESLINEIKNRPQDKDKEPWFNHIGIKYASYIYKRCDEETEGNLQLQWGVAQNELWKMKTAARATIDYNHSVFNTSMESVKKYERVTFHPNYSYAQFVGTYKPVQDSADENQIKYEYIPGPFMRIYVAAKQNPSQNFLLLIEEINRANVAAVFGDVFQLLDRDENGNSEYPVAASEDIKKYLAKNGIHEDELKIPSNMYIWATMNSADQGVFPMDTAFKRRWEFEYIGIDENEDKVKNYEIPISATKKVNWNELRKAINNKLITLGINEDKLLGPFFLSKTVLDSALDKGMDFVKLFESKVLMYLFEDAAKMKAKQLFNVDEKKFIYSEVCKKFELEGLKVFKFNEEDVVEEHDIAIKKDDAPSDGKLF